MVSSDELEGECWLTSSKVDGDQIKKRENYCTQFNVNLIPISSKVDGDQIKKRIIVQNSM